jgi:ZipA, C-terminal FtsZ-binding domain
MISDFQLALGGAAAAIVVGVLVYNRWQETKYKRRAERAFGTDHPDVLIDGAGANVKSANSANDRVADSRVEPAFASAPTKRDVLADRVEPHIGGGLPRAEAAVPPASPVTSPAPMNPRPTNYQAAPAPMADDDFDDLMPIGAIGEPVLGMGIDVAHTVSPPALHAEIDSMALILADETLSPNQYQPMVAHTEKLGKGVRWEGLVGGLWQGILRDTHESFRELRAGMQLADRQGAIDQAALAAFNDLIVKFSASVNAVSQREDVSVAARRAQAIDAFCADTDIEIAVNVVGKNGGTFAVTKLRGLAESKGMLAIDSGEYVMRDDRGHLLFTLRNFDPAEPPGIKRSTGYIAGISFALDVPRTPNAHRVFEQMFNLGQQFADVLQGEVVDDNRRALTANGRKVIADTIVHISTEMEAKGIEPGSATALRLYV